MKNLIMKHNKIPHKLVKLSPNSKAFKKAIAKSKGVLNGSPDIWQVVAISPKGGK